jgi:hypothetical protein
LAGATYTGRHLASITRTNDDLFTIAHASNDHSLRDGFENSLAAHTGRVNVHQANVLDTASDIARHGTGFRSIAMCNHCAGRDRARCQHIARTLLDTIRQS